MSITLSNKIILGRRQFKCDFHMYMKHIFMPVLKTYVPCFGDSCFVLPNTLWRVLTTTIQYTKVTQLTSKIGGLER